MFLFYIMIVLIAICLVIGYYDSDPAKRPPAGKKPRRSKSAGARN